MPPFFKLWTPVGRPNTESISAQDERTLDIFATLGILVSQGTFRSLSKKRYCAYNPALTAHGPAHSLFAPKGVDVPTERARVLCLVFKPIFWATHAVPREILELMAPGVLTW